MSTSSTSTTLHLLSSRVNLDCDCADFSCRVRRWFSIDAHLENKLSSGFPNLRITAVSHTSDCCPRTWKVVQYDTSCQLPRAKNGVPTSADAVVAAITHWVAFNDTQYFTLHAAAVRVSGKTIVLPGHSGSGKSTLVASLLSSGFSLHSDELVAIHIRRKRVANFSRNVHLRRDALRVLGKDALQPQGFQTSEGVVVSPEDLGGKWAAEGAIPSAIVFPQYSGETWIHQLQHSEALARILESTCIHESRCEHDIECAIWLAQFVPVYDLGYATLYDAASMLRSIV